jgi:hypothetical protein
LTIDFGTVDINTLANIHSRLLYRPLDDLTPRAGARALGMAGAYLATAAGPEALAWNPAGLAFSDRTVIASDLFIDRAAGSTSGFPLRFGNDIPQVPPVFVSTYDENLKSQIRFGFVGISGSLLSLGGRPLAVGAAYRRHTNLAYPEEVVSHLRFIDGTTTVPLIVASDNQESGALEAATLGLAYQIVPGFGVGLSANYLSGIFRSNFGTQVSLPGGFAESGSGRFALDYSGFSVEGGARADIGGRLSLGAWVGLPHTIEVTNGSFRVRSVETPGVPTNVLSARLGGYDLDVPLFYSLGAAVQVTSRLRVSGDFNARPWGDADLSYHLPEVAALPNASDFYPAHDSRSFHFGGEYDLLRKPGYSIPIRAGFAVIPLTMPNADSSDTLDVALTVIPRIDGTVTVAGGDGDPAFYGEATTDAVAFSLGLSLILPDMAFHGGFEARRYEFERLFFESTGERGFDFLINPGGSTGTVERLEQILRVSAEYSF